MGKYRFTPTERYAVFRTHGNRCYIGGEPIDFGNFQVDHIIPESLGERPLDLQEVLADLGCPPTFELNSFENWLPACARCNAQKRAIIWRPSLLVQRALQDAADGAQDARERAQAAVGRAEVTRAINVLERVAENGGPLHVADVEKLAPLVEGYAGIFGWQPSAVPELIFDEALYHLLQDMGLDGDAMVDPEAVRQYYFGQ